MISNLLMHRFHLTMAALSVLAMSVFVPAPAMAHRATVFAWVDGDTVHVISKFSGGRKGKNALIEVYDTRGNLLHTGNTDSEGKMVFSAPQKSDLKIVLRAGMGHRAEWTVRADEFEKHTHPEQPAVAASESKKPASSMAEPSDRPLSADQVISLVEQALDRKLKPIMQMLSENRQTGPTISDIVGGLGYILGLVGLGAYIQFRRNKNSKK